MSDYTDYTDYTNETVEVKTCDLIDAALDWAVAKCKGYKIQYSANTTGVFVNAGDGYEYFNPSRDWDHGGPIIEREKISPGYWGNKHSNTGIWIAHHQKGYKRIPYEGETFLIAAMRCYVASKLGDTVEIPKDLFLGAV